ncbi:MAG TPA: DUF2023 family protein [Candidatus Adamsella sp.]|nr:DUF2023 family protein [Candidatus Adamsella sp.]
MQLFKHSLYELSKGVRGLVLLTDEIDKTDKMVERLEREQIPYEYQKINNNKANLYFGKQECVDIIKKFNTKELNKLSKEQDFILGTMLGYNLCDQCKRYLSKK